MTISRIFIFPKLQNIIYKYQKGKNRKIDKNLIEKTYFDYICSVFFYIIFFAFMSKSIIQIAKNPLYEIFVDETLNRLLVKSIGFWRSPEAVLNYVDDMKKAVGLLKPNFQCLNDTSELLTTPAAVQEKVIFPTVKLLQEAGLMTTAIILPKEEISKMSTTRIAGEVKRSTSKIEYFGNREEAEAWLDLMKE
jgi:hypothetical protein